ncbi:MAG: hypothetical protein U5L45_21315 [Saprospiraceae bacterium]|nr:hypothetical protein [Saprospiraceae bacterium]
MHYISPFRSLGISDFDAIDKNTLNLAKKKLLAEIDLSPTNTIIREGQELSKDTIIKTFDKLTQVNNWETHRAIAKDLPLLAFLENQTFANNIFASGKE